MRSMTGYRATVPLPSTIPPPKLPMSTPTTPTTPIPILSPDNIPFPYHTYTYLYEQIIPSTQTMRSVMIIVPVYGEDRNSGGMDVDATNAGLLVASGSSSQAPPRHIHHHRLASLRRDSASWFIVVCCRV